jgi:hypothetical protein
MKSCYIIRGSKNHKQVREVDLPAEIRAGKSKIKGGRVDQCEYLNLMSISYLTGHKLV